MKKFRVWFDQVNTIVYDVTAKDDVTAVKKAIKQWKREYGTPESAAEVIELPIDRRESCRGDVNGNKN